MTRRSLSPLRISAAVLALGVSACSSSEPVSIGVVVSGEAVPGAQLAASEINASGGINGRLLALRVMSAGGATRASLALAAAESLAHDRSVIAVVGHSNSSASLSGSQVYNALGVVQIAPTSTAPLLSLAGPYTFRMVASDVHQARFIAREVVAGGTKPRIAIFYVNDDYGHALRDELRKRLEGDSVPVVYETPYTEEQPLTDVGAIARAVASAGPELLVWLGRSVQLRQLLPVLRPKLPRLRVLASDGIDGAETQRNTNGVFTGVQYVCFFDINTEHAPLRDLRTRFRARTGLPPTAEAALTYDAVMLVATAARAAGPRRDAIRDYLASLGTRRPGYAGATGVIVFDENGDPQPSYCLADITAQGTRIVPDSR